MLETWFGDIVNILVQRKIYFPGSKNREVKHSHQHSRACQYLTCYLWVTQNSSLKFGEANGSKKGYKILLSSNRKIKWLMWTLFKHSNIYQTHTVCQEKSQGTYKNRNRAPSCRVPEGPYTGRMRGCYFSNSCCKGGDTSRNLGMGGRDLSLWREGGGRLKGRMVVGKKLEKVPAHHPRPQTRCKGA